MEFVSKVKTLKCLLHLTETTMKTKRAMLTIALRSAPVHVAIPIAFPIPDRFH